MKKRREKIQRASSLEEAASHKLVMKGQLDDNFDAVNPKNPKKEVFPGDDDEVDAIDGDIESKSEIHKPIKQQNRLATKMEQRNKDLLHSSRRQQVHSLPETCDDKRPITYEMEKNRGLMRQRKKQSKNPRKKYKNKYIDALLRREGQVRKVKKPMGSYGGEATGINPGISRSIRFKCQRWSSGSRPMLPSTNQTCTATRFP